MGYILKGYQEKVVNQVGTRIKESEIKDAVACLAQHPGDVDAREVANRKYGVQVKAPTGAGKTIILGSIIREHLKDFVTLVFSPGSGNLEEQTAKKLSAITSSTEVITESSFNFAPVPGRNYVSNWEALVSVRKGSNAYITKLSKESESNNIFDWLGQLRGSKTPVAIIIDESHHGSAKASGAISAFLEDIRRTLGYSPYLIEASATPILKDVAKDTVEVPVRDVIKAGLLRRTVRLNDGASQIIEQMEADKRGDTDVEQVIFEAAFQKLEQIDVEYVKVGSKYHGLLAIQLPSSVAGKEAIERVKAFFRPKGITVENGQMALFMNGAKEGDMDTIMDPDSPVRVLLYKQGISMGWDCPRAQVLVGLRHLTSKVFTTQNLGRFIRTTEAKHYGNDVLDSAYVYSNVGDMGSKNFDKDADHTLPYESEMLLRKERDGEGFRYALQSINNLELEQVVLARTNQDSVDLKQMRLTWLQKARETKLWDDLVWVDTHETTNTLSEGFVDTEKAITGGDDDASFETSTKGVGVDDAVRWAELGKKIYGVVTADGRDFGGNQRIADKLLEHAVRWMVEALVRPVNIAENKAHHGQAGGILAQEKEFVGGELRDVNAFATELLLDDVNFAKLAKVLDATLKDDEVKPITLDSAESATRRDLRKPVTVGKYMVPTSLKVTATDDYKVANHKVGKYAYYLAARDGDDLKEEAYRQEKDVSTPEILFESAILDSGAFGDGVSLAYFMKSGTYREKNLSFAVSNGVSDANFFPDYLLELSYVKEDGKVEYIPFIAETKDGSMNSDKDDMVFEKAAKLIEVSKSGGKKHFPAGVVFVKDDEVRIVTEVTLRDGKHNHEYKTEKLSDYIKQFVK